MKESGLKYLMVDYFQNIFTSYKDNMELVLEHVTACITNEMNQKLVELYSMEEVKDLRLIIDHDYWVSEAFPVDH